VVSSPEVNCPAGEAGKRLRRDRMRPWPEWRPAEPQQRQRHHPPRWPHPSSPQQAVDASSAGAPWWSSPAERW